MKAAFRLYDEILLSGKEAVIFSYCDTGIPDEKYSARSLQYYQKLNKIDYSYIKQEAFNLFHSLANMKVDGAVTLRSLTSYQGVSLWDLSSVSVFPELISLLYDINISEAVFDLERPQEVHILNTGGKLEEIFKLICREREIPCLIRTKMSGRALLIKKLLQGIIGFLKRLKRCLLSFLFLIINLSKSKKLKDTYKVIFFTPLGRFFNSMLPVILRFEEEDRLVVNTYDSATRKRLDKENIIYTDFYGYKIYSLFNFKVFYFLKRIKKIVCYNRAFFSKLRYKQLLIGSLLADLFEKTINEEFPERMRDTDTVRKIILCYKPKVIVITDCLFVISSIAKSLQVSILAIQTGHAEEFILYGPTAADAITVDGKYWKEYLSAKNVDPDKIWVTGPAQFDLLEREGSISKSRNFPLKLHKANKVVVFASIYASPAFGMLDYERTEQVYLVFNAIKRIKDVHLVIKVHPYDFDYGIYNRVAKEIGLTDYSIINYMDMLDVLKNCDLLITHFSRASYEAVLMNKNVLLLCYNSDFISEDIWDFKRYGAVASVDNLADLEERIRQTLFNEKILRGLDINRRVYISEHAYEMDGRAAERIRAVIEQLV